MGFFDRFRRNNVQKYEFQNRPFVDRSEATPMTNDYVRTRRRSDSWLWLLLIPLFLLLGLGAYSYLTNSSPNGFRANQPNFISNLFDRGDQDRSSENGDSGLRFGIGGAPATATPTPNQSGLTPTSTPTPVQDSNLQDESDEDQESGRVQSASERQIPSSGPSTGRAER